MMKNYAICLLMLFVPVLATAQEADIPALFINEVQVANLDQYLDNANCYGAWIELYNPSSEDIALQGMYLSDGENTHRLSGQGSVPAGILRGTVSVRTDRYQRKSLRKKA